MLPLGLVIATGLLLMVKKDFAWIQPPTMEGEAPDDVPVQDFGALFAAARALPEMEIEDWRDLDRVDVKPGKGVIKFVSHNRWEAQIDTETAEVVQLSYRRSDLIESLHDGSFFSDEVKRFVFLPSGVVLLILWGTGIYLFFLPHAKKHMKARGKGLRGRKLR
jgi:hypothetical protein